ncbi:MULTISPECIES: hypothetical protein [Streptomyces]|uniref:Sortase n=1 Tax=Streptomyces dengpaensis TaxID=2049881 RepID=A0ABN5I681_9ACTN|nr:MULTISPECIES: hypothetical protein [Streptomyces]AVH58551.1 hypothetical protein C4B68_25410 [Streptomyces dengpaensis]PIB11389.1 hypothetical protein B1C81_06215 [Streptomyces sp. HG99]
MRSLRLTLCAGAVVAAACTPMAYAADADVSVSPASPAPGSDIQLRANGCTGRTGTAHSVAFVADAQLTGPGGGALTGETRVPTSLAPGTYEVKVSCDGADGKVNGAIVVVPQGEANASGNASPVAPVHAGGGGTAHLASADGADTADARATGPGTLQAVIGLVLAGVAAVAVAVRSARRGRDSRE